MNYLEKRVLLFLLQFVVTKKLETAVSLLLAETIFVALEKYEDVVDDNGF